MSAELAELRERLARENALAVQARVPDTARRHQQRAARLAQQVAWLAHEPPRH